MDFLYIPRQFIRFDSVSWKWKQLPSKTDCLGIHNQLWICGCEVGPSPRPSRTLCIVQSREHRQTALAFISYEVIGHRARPRPIPAAGADRMGCHLREWRASINPSAERLFPAEHHSGKYARCSVMECLREERRSRRPCSAREVLRKRRLLSIGFTLSQGPAPFFEWYSWVTMRWPPLFRHVKHILLHQCITLGTLALHLRVTAFINVYWMQSMSKFSVLRRWRRALLKNVWPGFWLHYFLHLESLRALVPLAMLREPLLTADCVGAYDCTLQAA